MIAVCAQRAECRKANGYYLILRVVLLRSTNSRVWLLLEVAGSCNLQRGRESENMVIIFLGIDNMVLGFKKMGEKVLVVVFSARDDSQNLFI